MSYPFKWFLNVLECLVDTESQKKETAKKTYKIFYFWQKVWNEHNLFLDNDHHHLNIIIIIVFIQTLDF